MQGRTEIDQAPDEDLRRRLATAHLPVGAGRLYFEPIRTGKHNRSFFVHTDQGEAVLRIAPPPDVGMLFYERKLSFTCCGETTRKAHSATRSRACAWQCLCYLDRGPH